MKYVNVTRLFRSIFVPISSEYKKVFGSFARRVLGCSRSSQRSEEDGTVTVTDPSASRDLSSLQLGQRPGTWLVDLPSL
jgi:hypothetical protein